MGICYTLFNHDTLGLVELHKGPWWLFQEEPNLFEAHFHNIADEINAEWGRHREAHVEYVAYQALHIYAFVRTGVWGVPEPLPEGPIQRVDVLSDSTGYDALPLPRESYQCVGVRGPGFDPDAVTRHFPPDVLELVGC